MLAAAYRAFAELDLDPDRTVIVSGIGCSSRFPGFVTTYGFHGVHGRALPTAMGVKLANPDLDVIAVGGDGDGFAIGGGHFPHAARRNVDITYIIMNNQTYGLTKGQVSPTSLHDQKSPSTPFGNLEEPMNVLATAIAADCSLRRAGRELPLEGADGADRRGHPPAGLQLHRRVQPLHRVQQHDAGVEGSGPQPARRARLRPTAPAAFAAALDDPMGIGIFYRARAARRSTAACARCRRRAPPGSVDELVDGFAVAEKAASSSRQLELDCGGSGRERRAGSLASDTSISSSAYGSARCPALWPGRRVHRPTARRELLPA